jgi:hypothetical protein
MKVLIPATLALVLGLAAGCGRMPTAPDAGTAAPQSVAMANRTAQSNGLIGDLVGGVVKLLVRVLNVVGSVGGSLTNGRWRVDVPAGAFEGSATVSIGVESLASPSCDLEIAPLSKNNFAKPVMLTANCSSVPDVLLRNYVILWWNPAARRWVEVSGSKVDLTRKTVSAPLQHFSKYAVGPKGGKAGW